jgi:hypothetical protein
MFRSAWRENIIIVLYERFHEVFLSKKLIAGALRLQKYKMAEKCSAKTMRII